MSIACEMPRTSNRSTTMLHTRDQRLGARRRALAHLADDVGMKTRPIRGFSGIHPTRRPVLTRYGGKVLAAGGTIEGDWHPNQLAILEFESVEQAIRWYHSDEYAQVKNIRLKTANTQLVLVQGIHHLQRAG